MSSAFLFRCECLFFLSAKTEKGSQRISVQGDLQLPFAPTVGMHIGLGPDIPNPKLTEVVWDVQEQAFHLHGEVELENWTASIFEPLVDDLTEAGYATKLYDDNWMDRLKTRTR